MLATNASLGHVRGTMNTAYRDANLLQSLLLKAVQDKEATLSGIAQASRSWCELEERKRILRGKPLVKSVDAHKRGKRGNQSQFAPSFHESEPTAGKESLSKPDPSPHPPPGEGGHQNGEDINPPHDPAPFQEISPLAEDFQGTELPETLFVNRPGQETHANYGNPKAGPAVLPEWTKYAKLPRGK